MFGYNFGSKQPRINCNFSAALEMFNANFNIRWEKAKLVRTMTCTLTLIVDRYIKFEKKKILRRHKSGERDRSFTHPLVSFLFSLTKAEN